MNEPIKILKVLIEFLDQYAASHDKYPVVGKEGDCLCGLCQRLKPLLAKARKAISP